MSRQCRDCTRPAAKGRRQCYSCAKRAPSWAVVDETDVQLIVEAPRPVEGLTRLERVLIARGLNGRDMTAEQIAVVVGVTPRTVYRWRRTEPAAARAAA